MIKTLKNLLKQDKERYKALYNSFKYDYKSII